MANLANCYPFHYPNMSEKATSTHTYNISPLSPPATRDTSPTPTRQARPHARVTYEAWQKLNSLLKGEQVVLDGEGLDIPTLIAVAKLVFSTLLMYQGSIADDC